MPFSIPLRFRGARVSTAAGFAVANGIETQFAGFTGINFDSEGNQNLGVLQGIRVPAGVRLIQYGGVAQFQANGAGIRYAYINLNPAGATQSAGSMPSLATLVVNQIALATNITQINGVAQDLTLIVFQNSGAPLLCTASIFCQYFY